MSPQKQNVWLVTGSSAGLGREIVIAAAKRGDKVVATARRLESIKDLESDNVKILQLDITDSLEVLKAKAKEADKLFDKPVNVLLNNAGYGAFGVVEESTADIINEQFNVNVIGPINLSKAFLPSLRAQGSNGWLLFMSSVGAWFSMPGGSVYQASKHALRGLSNGLAHELEPIGTHVLAVEPGMVKTRFFGQDSLKPFGETLPGDPYKEFKKDGNEWIASLEGGSSSDAAKCAERTVDIVHGTGLAKGKKTPREVILGADGVKWVSKIAEDKVAEIKEWKEFSESTAI